MNKINKKILIIPAAAYKSKYEDFIPEIFMLNIFGEMNIISNMKGLPIESFDQIYITINRRVDELYNIEQMLNVHLNMAGIGNISSVIKIRLLWWPTLPNLKTVLLRGFNVF